MRVPWSVALKVDQAEGGGQQADVGRHLHDGVMAFAGVGARRAREARKAQESFMAKIAGNF